MSLMTDSHTSVLESPSLLSEASLLQSSPADYMNSKQLDFFRQRLLTLKGEITRNALATAEQLREAEAPSDEADRATLEEEYALALRIRHREDKLLEKIEAALHRIEDGSYGYCEESSEPIGLPRLLARPTATLSIEAQERRERRQKLFAV
jgi:DnaK suppressor protein